MKNLKPFASDSEECGFCFWVAFCEVVECFALLGIILVGVLKYKTLLFLDKSTASAVSTGSLLSRYWSLPSFIRSESGREESLKLRNDQRGRMSKDEGYYSFEHNPLTSKMKLDASTQTRSEKTIGKSRFFHAQRKLIVSWMRPVLFPIVE